MSFTLQKNSSLQYFAGFFYSYKNNFFKLISNIFIFFLFVLVVCLNILSRSGTKGTAKNSTLAIIGFLLSPLSWWNDLVINIPIAYAFGTLFGVFSKQLFLPFTILGYWLTNIFGLLLLHYGTAGLSGRHQGFFSKRELAKNALLSIFYTAFIACLFAAGILKFPTEYFSYFFPFK